MSQYEYRHVPPAVVQLNVIANLIIEPSDTYMLPGDIIQYKLIQVRKFELLSSFMNYLSILNIYLIF